MDKYTYLFALRTFKLIMRTYIHCEPIFFLRQLHLLCTLFAIIEMILIIFVLDQSLPGQVLRHASMASRKWGYPGRLGDDGCSSGHVSPVRLQVSAALSALNTFFVVLLRISSTGSVVTRTYILDKNIVHLIADITATFSGIWDSRRPRRPNR